MQGGPSVDVPCSTPPPPKSYWVAPTQRHIASKRSGKKGQCARERGQGASRLSKCVAYFRANALAPNSREEILYGACSKAFRKSVFGASEWDGCPSAHKCGFSPLAPPMPALAMLHTKSFPTFWTVPPSDPGGGSHKKKSFPTCILWPLVCKCSLGRVSCLRLLIRRCPHTLREVANVMEKGVKHVLLFYVTCGWKKVKE